MSFPLRNKALRTVSPSSAKICDPSNSNDTNVLDSTEHSLTRSFCNCRDFGDQLIGHTHLLQRVSQIFNDCIEVIVIESALN